MLWLVHTAILSRKWNKESVEKIPFQKSNWNFIDLNRILCKLNLANIWSMKLVFRFDKSAGEIVNGNAHTSVLSFQIRSIAFTKLCRFQRRTHSTVMATWTKQIQEKWSKYKQKKRVDGEGERGRVSGLLSERSEYWSEYWDFIRTPPDGVSFGYEYLHVIHSVKNLRFLHLSFAACLFKCCIPIQANTHNYFFYKGKTLFYCATQWLRLEH